MATQKLTEQRVKRLKTTGSEYTEWDSQVPGFGVRVTARGSKAFTFVYRGPNHQGRRVARRKSLGRPGVIALADARTKAREMYAGLHLDGVDPSVAQEGFTLGKACKEYQRDRGKKWKTSTSKEVGRHLSRVCDDLGGGRLLREIRRADVRELHDRYAHQPTKANRMLAWLSGVFTFAVQEAEIDANPCLGITRFDEKERDRALTLEEIVKVGEALDDEPNQVAADAVRILLLTGCRRNEILRRRVTDYDRDRKVLALGVTKNGSTRLKALGPEAREILDRRINGAGGGDWLFPGSRGDGPLHNARRASQSALKAAGVEDAGSCHHIYRHTYTTQGAEMGVSELVLDVMTGHKSGTMTSRYAHLSVDGITREAEESLQARLAVALRGRKADVLALLRTSGP